MSLKFETMTGTYSSALPGTPSWPLSLLPKEKTFPNASRINVWYLPALT